MPESSRGLTLEEARQQVQARSAAKPHRKGVTLAEARGEKPAAKSSTSSRIAADVAGVVDLPLSLPGMAASVLGEVGGRLGTAAVPGTTRKEIAQEGARVGQEFAEPLMNPVSKLMKHFGYGEDYQKSDVTKALTTLSGWISHGAQWIEDHTHGAILKEDAQLLTNAILTGGPVELAKKVFNVKPKAKPLPATKPGTADFMKRLDETTDSIEKEVKEVGPKDKPKAGEPTFAEVSDILKKPAFTRSAEDLVRLRNFNKQGGGVKPETLMRMGLASAGTLAGLYAVGGDDLQKKFGVSAMAAAVFAGVPEGARAMGPLLDAARYGSRVLDRLPKGQTLFSKEQIKSVLNQQDIPKAEKEIIGKIVEEHPAEKMSAEQLMQQFQLATQDFVLHPERTEKFADYGVERIRPAEKVFSEDEDIPATLPARTDVWTLPPTWNIPSSGHFTEMGPNQFGHTRSFMENGVRHVVEMQSDLLQHQKIEKITPETRALVEKDIKDWQETLVGERLKESKLLEEQRSMPGFERQTKIVSEIRIVRHNVNTARARIGELEASLAGSKISALEPLAKQWPRRLIQEELARAGREGQSKVRFASADTVAEVEGWPRWTPTEKAAGVKGEFESPQHQSIYDRYKDEITKYLKAVGGKPFTDSEGHTWWEVPTNRGPAKMFGQADPRLLTKIAGLTGGAVIGSYLASKDNKVEGTAAGMVAGLALATFAGRVFPKLDPEPGLNAEKLSGSLERLVGQYKANQIELLNFSAAFAKQVPDYQKHVEAIYHSLEDPKVQLDPRAQEIKTKYVEPFLKQNAALRARLKAEGVDVGEDVDSYVHRVAKGKPSIFEQVERTSPQGKTFSHFAPPLEERAVFSIKDPVTGAKLVAVKDPTGTGFKVYQGKKIVGAGKVKPAEWESGDIQFEGKTWKRGQATTKEIEAQTNIEYHHDALAASISANARLTKALNNVKFVNELLKSKDASKIAAKRNAPVDWREVPQIPQLRGWKFEPRTANVLEDFAATPGGDLTEGMGKISRFLTGSMFWNPLPHIFNVLDHSIVQRGLVSGWLNPAAYPRLMRTSIRAARAVTERNEDYQRFIKEGGGLMYPNVLLQDFSQKILEQLGHREEMGPVAKAWGYANPLEMTKRIYAFSRKNLWAANDILMMQAYLEKEMIRPESVIKNVEKHIPNYRIPDQVMGSRMISQMLRSPIALAFGRYDYGRMRSYGEMVKDALGKDSSIKDRGKALDQIAMLTVMGALIYPLVMDEGAKALTGDETATAQRFGASTIPWLVYQYLHKEKSASQVTGSAFPMGMALKSAVELSSNRDLFTGKHLIEDPKDIPQYLLRQLQPVGTAAKVQSGKMKPEDILYNALGIRIPSKKKHETIK